MKRILLLEDDEALRAGIILSFRQDGYEFVPCETIGQARKAIKERGFDLLVLDVNLPDGSGFDLCREIRAGSRVPIILLTARDLETDIVGGLECGADDYITKPFSLMVLRARIRALLRRSESPDEDQKGEYRRGLFHFSFASMEFYKGEKPLSLSRTEQRLLYVLVFNPGVLLTRERLLERVWPDGTEYVEDNALSVSIRRLRDKMEDSPANPEFIKTVYGKGYMWVNPL